MPCGSETLRACSTSDGEIEKLVLAGTIDLDTGLAYATNPGNLRRQLADAKTEAPIESAIPSGDASEPELVFERWQRVRVGANCRRNIGMLEDVTLRHLDSRVTRTI